MKNNFRNYNLGLRNFNKGFTLIELLVVVAIIGILAATILAALGGARKQGIDAAIKSELNSARSQGEIYANTHGFKYYVSDSDNACYDPIIANIIVDLTGKDAAPVCEASSGSWAMSAQLQAEEDIRWCVDSSGYAGPTGGITTECLCQ